MPIDQECVLFIVAIVLMHEVWYLSWQRQGPITINDDQSCNDLFA